jgi:hypothetical protein
MNGIALLGLICLLLNFGCAGMQQAPESELTIQQVYEVPGSPQDKIYNEAKIWVAENFRSAKAVIEHDDAKSGTLIGNGNMKYPCSGLDCVAKNDWKVHFTMRMDTKDNRFRLTFSNLMLSWPSSYNTTFGYQKGQEVRVWQQGDVNIIRPELLQIGNNIAAAVKNSAGKSTW